MEEKEKVIELDVSLHEIVRTAGQAAITGLCAAVKISRDANGELEFSHDVMTIPQIAHLIGVRFAIQHMAWVSNDPTIANVVNSDDHKQVSEFASEISKCGKQE